MKDAGLVWKEFNQLRIDLQCFGVFPERLQQIGMRQF